MGKGCKVVVCGQAAVGKTAILEQLLYGNHCVGKQGSDSQATNTNYSDFSFIYMKYYVKLH